MDNPSQHRFRKSERLCSKKALDKLFNQSHRSVSSYPLRAVYAPAEESGVRILVSVSKRNFKRAVHRNHVKRLIRENYRLHKDRLSASEKGIHIAFLWNSNEIPTFATVQKKMQSLLSRINESLTTPAQIE